MKIRLLRDSRILHKAGEILEVSPETARHLISLHSASAIEEAEKKAETKKGTRKAK